MSVDYYLISQKARRRAQVGSIGFGGVQSYPGSPEAVQFIRDAIDSLGQWDDIQFLDENKCYELMDRGKWTEEEQDR